MAIKYEQNKIPKEFIYNGYISSFGWSGDQGTNFEITIRSYNHNYISKIIFEFATEFEMQLSFTNKGDTIPIKYFKCFFNDIKYNINIEFGEDVTGHINFNCNDIHYNL